MLTDIVEDRHHVIWKGSKRKGFLSAISSRIEIYVKFSKKGSNHVSATIFQE